MPPNPIAAAIDGLRPVVFDHGAADHLVAALHALHQEATGVRRADGEASNVARAEWRGFTRGWFEDRHAALHLDLRQLALDAQDLADEVRRAQQTALSRQADHEERVRLLLRLAAPQQTAE